MFLDILAEFVSCVLARKRVGVITVRQEHHLHVHAFAKQHVGTAQGSLDAGIVTIVKQHYVLRETVQQVYLMLRKCRTRVCHHILYAALVHGDNVGIALHHIHEVFLGYRLLRLEYAV